MYAKNDKRRIYQLITMYLADEIDIDTFCDEIYYSYDLELDYDALSTAENQAFYELSRVAGRFSSSQSDHKKYPGVYYTEKDLKDKVLETKDQLTVEFNELQRKGEL